MSTATVAAPSLQTETPARGPHKAVFVSLRLKLVLGFTLLFTLIFVGVYYWFYSLATADALSGIKESLTDTITGAVAGIDGDEFAALVRDGQRNSNGQSDHPGYASQLAWFTEVASIDPHAYPYSYVAGPDVNGSQTNLFIVDYLQVADPTRAADFKEPWVLNSGESRGGLEQLTFKLTPYTDQWGSWVSAYAPIKDSSGAVIGALGVDYRADYIYKVQRDILIQFIPAIFLTYVALVLLVFAMSRALTTPVRKLTHAALRIADGDYDQKLTDERPSRIDDEISTLTRVFEVMVAKVREREQILARKLERLTIEIDEAKREQEVNQIVETDYFQKLQGRADEMRRRRESRPRSDETSS
jgi:methyl-accepting chemotaxis protein